MFLRRKLFKPVVLDVNYDKKSRDQIDPDEKKLLSELVKNSNEKIDSIAKQCGFSRQKAWRIIKNLEEKGVI